MSKPTNTLLAVIAGAALSVSAAAGVQEVLLVVDSSNNRVASFNPFDGSILSSTYIDLAPQDSGTPSHALQVGNEIWVSDQIRDKIGRYSLTGQFISNIGGAVPGGGLDNIRGLQVVGNEVWVTNAGTGNDAPGNALVRINPASGSILGSIPVDGSSWFITPYNGEFLVSFSGTSTTRIERYDAAGNLLGNFLAPNILNFIQQTHENSAGDILAAAFSNNNAAGNPSSVYEIDADGNLVGPVAGTTNFGPRGVWELGNGNIMWTNGAGVHIADAITGQSELILPGSGRYISFVVIPGPGGAAVLAMAGLAAARRRR